MNVTLLKFERPKPDNRDMPYYSDMGDTYTYEEFLAEAQLFRDFMGSREVMLDPERRQGCMKGLTHVFLAIDNASVEELERATRLWETSLEEMERRAFHIDINPPPWATQ